jgi:putative heme-binding domain-containing protein
MISRSIHNSLALVIVALLLTTVLPSAIAQDTLLKVPKPDVSNEMEAFNVADGFEVNLFASDPMIANPINMHWDDQGRLWIVGSAVYPHILPGQSASDTITVIEDTDGDGVADKSSVFADNLFIPTGIAYGDGGVYVANSTEILHLKDTDGDLVADETRVVLSGFGTEDTHHIVHSLRWGYEGLLYFNQSIYIHTHIETPHGPRHLNAGGVWQYRTDTMELEVFTRGLVNSWGHHFDPWGQSFQTDGAGGEGINYVFPGAAFTSARDRPRVLRGLNPGSPKHSGLEIINGRHFPEDWRGTMVTNDFRGHRVVRFKVAEDQSGYSSVEQPEILTSSHVAFRPVDVKMGPDGALYIADWYNPIIQHGEVDFRDPRRDHEHGRIWRVTKKDSPLVKHPPIAKASIEDLIGLLREPEQWNRIHAKRELRTRNRSEVVAALEKTLAGLKSSESDFENARLEILWTYQTLDVVNEDLLNTLLESTDHRVRAAAVRTLSQWKSRLNKEADYIKVLTKKAEDDHPRVRLEAVRALARAQHPKAADAAMLAMQPGMDRFIEYALWATVRDLKDSWMPDVDDVQFAKDNEKLLYALKAVDTHDAVGPLLKAYRTTKLTSKQEREALRTITTHANASELGTAVEHLLKESNKNDADRARQLNAIVAASKRRNVKPRGDLSEIDALIQKGPGALKVAAIAAAGQWKLDDQTGTLEEIATSQATPFNLRNSAMNALAAMGGNRAEVLLTRLTDQKETMNARIAATRALLSLSPEKAAEIASTLLSELDGQDPAPLFRDFIRADGGVAALTAALKDKTIPNEVAKIGERAITASGRKQPDLLMAISRAGKLDDEREEFTAQQMAEMVEAVQKRGDAKRGREHFKKLDCVQCHALAGSGGNLGPDLTSIGGSAQIDYLIESNFFPSKAIKEGYHSLLIETKNGEFYSGITISETDTELILRDSESDEVRIPIDTIATRDDGGSLMPTGLGDSLLENEFLDLVRYLSELGRTPDFSAGTGRFARTLRVLSDTTTAEDYLYEAQPEAAIEPHESLAWVQAYSNINGSIPLRHVPSLRHRYWRKSHSFLKFTLETTTAGKAAVAVAPMKGARLWVGGKQVELTESTLLDLKTGQTECILILDRSQAKKDVNVQLVDDSRTTITASFVGGR